MSRLHVIKALEALEDGDQRLACDILLDALEECAIGRTFPPACAICGQHAWPGDHARHIWSLHRETLRAAA